MKTKKFIKVLKDLDKHDLNHVEFVEFLINTLEFQKKKAVKKEKKMFKAASKEIANMRMSHPEQFQENFTPIFGQRPFNNRFMHMDKFPPATEEDCNKCLNKDICPNSSAKSSATMNKH